MNRFTGWMHSPGHRANVLGTSFEDVGLSIVRGSPTCHTKATRWWRSTRTKRRGGGW